MADVIRFSMVIRSCLTEGNGDFSIRLVAGDLPADVLLVGVSSACLVATGVFAPLPTVGRSSASGDGLVVDMRMLVSFGYVLKYWSRLAGLLCWSCFINGVASLMVERLMYGRRFIDLLAS